MSTKALIQQDKMNHRLQLHRIDALPRDIARDILQQVCRSLQISDVALIGPSIQKLTRVVTILPRLEKFADVVWSSA